MESAWQKEKNLHWPYIIIVEPVRNDGDYDNRILPTVTVKYHLEWLNEQYITGYRWDWNPKQEKTFGKRQYLQFRFESEHDKLLFALRWA